MGTLRKELSRVKGQKVREVQSKGENEQLLLQCFDSVKKQWEMKRWTRFAQRTPMQTSRTPHQNLKQNKSTTSQGNRNAMSPQPQTEYEKDENYEVDLFKGVTSYQLRSPDTKNVLKYIMSNEKLKKIIQDGIATELNTERPPDSGSKFSLNKHFKIKEKNAKEVDIKDMFSNKEIQDFNSLMSNPFDKIDTSRSSDKSKKEKNIFVNSRLKQHPTQSLKILNPPKLYSQIMSKEAKLNSDINFASASKP